MRIVCVLLNVFGSERNISTCVITIFLRRISLHFFHIIILAHFSSIVKSLIISYITHRRQSLTSTRFKSDETFYKIICKIVIVYRNFINRITRIIVWTGLDGLSRFSYPSTLNTVLVQVFLIVRIFCKHTIVFARSSTGFKLDGQTGKISKKTFIYI